MLFKYLRGILFSILILSFVFTQAPDWDCDADGVIDNLRNVGLRVFDGDDIKYMLDNGITPDMVGLGTPKDRNS